MPSSRSSFRWSTARLAVIATVLLSGAGCSEPKFELPTSPTDETTTTTTTTTTATNQAFSGTLDVRGERFYSFTVPSTQTVQLILDQLQTGAGVALTAPVVLGLGIPRGTSCGLLFSTAATASESPQFNEPLTAGIYCASLADPGNLTEPVAFNLRIEFP